MPPTTSKLSRRTLVQAGALSAALPLSRFLRAAQQSPDGDSGRSAVLVFLGGGPAHQDTFDLKPNAPAEYRGQFSPIATSVPELQICEHLPRLAKQMHRCTLVRGVTHSLADHGLGTRYMLTGNLPTPVLDYPLLGSLVSYELPATPDLPSFVSIDRPLEGPGYLGPAWGPLSTGEKPRYGQPFRVRGITLDGTLTVDAFNKRHLLLKDIDNAFKNLETRDPLLQGLDQFQQQACRMISSERSRKAFDLASEPENEMDRFGRHEFGQSMLLATRLVEAGVRFVTVLLEGWDTHQDNFNTLARQLLPQLDQSLSGMFSRLHENGLLGQTSILTVGEFGRTPKINGNAGRDHWAQASSAIFAGAGFNVGQVIGQTDAKAEGPQYNGFSPDDLAVSFLQAIGLNPKKEYDSPSGRPIVAVRDGEPIPDLLTATP
ncbi:MAG: hypothetical protein RLZZ458_3620 [Planctomycetota bacterium]|jgi:uncharacterized protein (DUF1501 family)